MPAKTSVEQLRKLLKKQGIDGFLQPLHDEFLSEYPPASNRRLEWLTGFTGSSGTAIVMRDKAAFFTDGRYTLQAAAQVDKAAFELHNSGDVTPEAWLARVAEKKQRLGYDPKITTRHALRRLEDALAKKNAHAV